MDGLANPLRNVLVSTSKGVMATKREMYREGLRLLTRHTYCHIVLFCHIRDPTFLRLSEPRVSALAMVFSLVGSVIELAD